MDRETILRRVDEIVTPVLANLGYELIERELILESGRWVLRLYIDKEGGVTIDDCERASRGIETLIEVEGIVPEHYVLEMSSPGLDRPLRRKQDFEKYSGSEIRLKTEFKIDGRMNYKGTLKGIAGDDILMQIDGIDFKIPISALAKARVILKELPIRGEKH